MKPSPPPVSGHEQRTLSIELAPAGLARLFGGAVACLFAVHTVTQILRFQLGNHRLFGLVPLFNLGIDGNIPTFYSGLALFFCALLLALIGYATVRSRGPDSLYWIGLAAVFTFLSMDEMMMLHEQLIKPVRGALNTSGLLYYAWVIPYGVASLVFAAVYARFLLRLPRAIAARFVVSGAIFVAGAIGMEMLGGTWFEAHGSDSAGYVLLQTIEEGLEMFGIVLFIHALSLYISLRFGALRIQLGPAVAGRRPAE